MTPKEKAIELIQKYVNLHTYNDSINIRKCALITVEEIIEETSKREGINDEIIIFNKYWTLVKYEIESL